MKTTMQRWGLTPVTPDFDQVDEAQLSASGIEPEIAAALGWSTCRDIDQMRADLHSTVDPEQCPSLRMPSRWASAAGQAMIRHEIVRHRPHVPAREYRPGREDRVMKYVGPAGVPTQPYLPMELARTDIMGPTESIWSGPSKKIWITEGEKKAVAHISHIGEACVSVPGVDCWREAGADIPTLHPSIRALGLEGRTVVIGYDTDMWCKPNVLRAAATMALAIAREGGLPVVADWRGDQALKGLDDRLVAVGAAEYRAGHDYVPAIPSACREWVVEASRGRRKREVQDLLSRWVAWCQMIEAVAPKFGGEAKTWRLGKRWWSSWAADMPITITTSDLMRLGRVALPQAEPATDDHPWAIEPGDGWERWHVLSDGTRLPAGTTEILTSSPASGALALIGALTDEGSILAQRHGSYVVYRDGWWQTMETDTLRDRVARWHLRRETADEHPVDATPRWIDDVMTALGNFLRTPSRDLWSASSQRWIACGDVSISLDGEDLMQAPHDPAHRAMIGYDWSWAEAQEQEPTTWDRAAERWMHPGPQHGLDESAALDEADAKWECVTEWFGRQLIQGPAETKRALILVGGAGRGKSTCLEALASAWPSTGRISMSPSLMDREYDLARLSGSTLNVVPEVPTRIASAAVENVKAVVECVSQVRARAAYGAPFDFRPATTHLWAGNDMPDWRDRSGAVWDRLIPIWLEGDKIRGTSADDQDLGVKLQEEIPAMVVRAIRVALRAIRAGRRSIIVPATSQTSVQDEQMMGDTVASWIAESDMFEVDPSGSTWLAAAEIHAEYARWCRDHGHEPMGLQKFVLRAASIGVGRARKRVTGRSNPVSALAMRRVAININ